MPRLRFALRPLLAPIALAATRFNVETLRRSTIALSWLAFLSVLVAAWVLGVPRLQAFASQAHQAGDVHVRFVKPPRWFHGEVADNIMRIAQTRLATDPMSRESLVACREALIETGWFEEVIQVRRVHADLVEVEARFARPYAVVRDDRGDHLVDVHCRLLPQRYERGARTNFIAIAGSRFERPAQPGERWEGADLAAAMRLLAVIEQQPWRAQVTAIDVAGHLDGKPMRLITDSGASIVWGSAPGEEPGLEVLATGKLKVIDFMHRTYGRIDAGESGREIDLTNPRYVGSRELTDES